MSQYQNQALQKLPTMDKFQAFGKNIRLAPVNSQFPFGREQYTLTLYSATFSPFAARTQQYVKEQLGKADAKV